MRSILLFCFVTVSVARLGALELELPSPTRGKPPGAVEYSATFKDLAEKMAMSPDGAKIVVAGAGGQIQLLEANTLKIVKSVDAGGPVAAIDISADGKEVLTAGPGNDVLVWNLETGKNTRKFTGHSGDVRAVACSPDGSRVASTDSVGTLRIWDFAEGKLLYTLTGKKYPDDPPTEGIVTDAVTYSPDGRFIVTEANDVKARVWDAVRGAELRMVPNHDGTAASVAISPNGSLVSTTRGGGILRLWKMDSGTVVRSISGLEGDVSCSVFAMDEFTVFTGANDNTVRQWDIETGLELRRFKLAGVPTGLVCSPDGKRVYSLSPDAGVVAWEINTLPLSSGTYAPSIQSPEAAWLALESADYDARSDGIAYFVKHPDPGAVVKFMLENLNNAGLKDSDRKAQSELIAKLDDSSYATRLKAAEDLKTMGRAAREALAQALKNPSSEVRTKVSDLLRDIGGTSDTRGLLVVESLRLMNKPVALEALKVIAAKDGPNSARAKALVTRAK